MCVCVFAGVPLCGSVFIQSQQAESAADKDIAVTAAAAATLDNFF